MKRFFVTQEQFNNRIINGDEFNHMKNVMRMTKGDDFIAFIGDEKDYECQITEIKKDYLTFSISATHINEKNPLIQIDIIQSLCKGEKLELVAQKATEIGISNFIPLYIKNCDVKPNTTKINRIEKIVVNACKQCGRSIIPHISNITDLEACLTLLKDYDLALFANEAEDNLRLYDVLNRNVNAKKIAIIVGPEGGFTAEEISKLKQVSQSISLGKRILRTETAGIYICSIVNDFYRN